MKKRMFSLILFVLIIFSNSLVFADTKTTTTWVPSSGYVNVQNSLSVSDARYLYSSWSWNNSSRLSGLKSDSNETLEGDIVLYNYDGNAYATSWHYNTDTAWSRGQYWESNQPRAYVDTQASDSISERSFCVGCADANDFEANKAYYWWAYAAARTSTGSQAKLNWARGHRTPSNIYSTWSVFADQTVKVIPFSSWYVPSSKSWSY